MEFRSKRRIRQRVRLWRACPFSLPNPKRRSAQPQFLLSLHRLSGRAPPLPHTSSSSSSSSRRAWICGPSASSMPDCGIDTGSGTRTKVILDAGRFRTHYMYQYALCKDGSTCVVFQIMPLIYMAIVLAVDEPLNEQRID